MGVACGN